MTNQLLTVLCAGHLWLATLHLGTIALKQSEICKCHFKVYFICFMNMDEDVVNEGIKGY
jgi:hypothetical protein